MEKLSIRTPADAIAYLPYSSGSLLQEKVGYIVQTENGVDTFTTNVPPDNPEDHQSDIQWATELLTLLMERRQRITRIVMVVYSESEEDFPFHNTLSTFAISAVMTMGVPVEGYVAGRGRWASYTDPDEHGTMEQVENSPIHAFMIARGKPIPREYQPPALPDPLDTVDEEALDKLTFERLKEFKGVRLHHITDPKLKAARDLWQKALDRDFGPTDTEARDLISYFAVTNVAARLMVDVVSLAPDDKMAAGIMIGRVPIHVDRKRVVRAVELVDNLFQYAFGHHRHTLLTVKAWLHWYNGDQQGADALVTVLREQEHVSPLAIVVTKAVDSHRPPLGTVMSA